MASSRNLVSAIWAGSVVIATLLVSSTVRAEWQSVTDQAMGTRIQAEAWHANPAIARAALQAVLAEMHRVDRAFSPYKEDSELSILNDQAPDGWTPVSAELLKLLLAGQRVSEMTQGAFDLTFASAGRYYDYRKGIAPDAQTLDATIAAIDYRHVKIDETGLRVRYQHPATYVDLGGIAKGYAVDQAIAILSRAGITQASVAAGGDSRILGDRRGQPWVVGVRHPRDADKMAVRLPLADTAISTSGDYERFFMKDGERFHHILDPSSGASAQKSMSVTILGPSGILTDALSTSVFVLGAVKGLALIDSMPGIDGIVIDQSGRMSYSSDLLPPNTAAAP